MAWGTLLSLNHENREGTFTGYVGVVHRLLACKWDAITVGTLDNYSFCSTSSFTLPGEIRLCDSPHSFDRSSRKPNRRLLVSAGRVGRHVRGRRGRFLADTDLTMVERLGAARNADS